MIGVWGTAAVLVAPPAALFLNGYAPGNSLAAQHYDYIWHSITSEIDNVLSAASITPNGAVNNQLITAIQALIAVVASSTQFGVVKVDNATIKATAGVLSTFNGVVPAPLPQTAAGVGQVTFVQGVVGSALNFPAGGGTYWAVSMSLAQNISGTWLCATIPPAWITALIGGSGTTFAGAQAGYQWEAEFMRIA